MQQMTGTIQEWSYKDGQKPGAKNKWHKVGIKVNGSWYSSFVGSAAAYDEISAAFPEGTVVDFNAEVKGNFNNFAASSLKKSTAKDSQVSDEPTDEAVEIHSQMTKPKPAAPFTSDNYWRTKAEFEQAKFKNEQDNQDSYAYMRCLDAAAQSVQFDMQKFPPASHVKAVTGHANAVINIADLFFQRLQMLKIKPVTTQAKSESKKAAVPASEPKTNADVDFAVDEDLI